MERIIWADAVCIDQQNNAEKEQQVQRMAEIYSKASRVIVWLGESDGDGERALEDIRLAADNMPGRPATSDLARTAILALLQRPWFTRVWVRGPPTKPLQAAANARCDRCSRRWPPPDPSCSSADRPSQRYFALIRIDVSQPPKKEGIWSSSNRRPHS
jgi:hypothetical protein